jgi:hypothetical protein
MKMEWAKGIDPDSIYDKEDEWLAQREFEKKMKKRFGSMKSSSIVNKVMRVARIRKRKNEVEIFSQSCPLRNEELRKRLFEKTRGTLSV